MRRVPGTSSLRRVAAPALAGLVATSAVLIGGLAPAATAAATSASVPVALQRGASTRIVAQPPGSGASTGAATEIPNTDVLERSPKVPGLAAPKVLVGIPNPTPQFLTSFNLGSSGFNGLSHYDSRTASGGNQWSLEPPDQGLCVGNGYVVEPVNDVLAVYDTNGAMRAGPEALNAFYGYAYSINRTTGAFGPFVTDPKCLYDAATGRFFLTVLTLDTDPSTGGFTGSTHVDIAVSQTGDPTGAWTIFHLYTTNDGTNGTPVHEGCPCLGDQPLIGADAYGFWVSTNEFPVFSNGFNGAQVYGMSKYALASAASGGTAPVAAMFDLGALATPNEGGIWYSVQPATSPGTVRYDPSGQDGTEYFLSALDFYGSSDNRIATWAITNTSSLGSGTPALVLSHVVIGSEAYASTLTWGVTQRPGYTPLGDLVDEGLEQLNANDDRMNQVVFAAGSLYSAVNTLVAGGSRTGIAYFVVTPSWSGGSFSASMANQGYVSLRYDNVLFPSIGVNSSAAAVMSFTISGPDYYPSTGYAQIFGSFTGPVHIAGVGQGPEDGFTGYAAYGGNGISRWGDYSAAVADSNGNLWLAAEYIPGGPRTLLANWGTFVSRVSTFGSH